ncbi:MAG: hypothetical protein ACRDQH_05060 [Pseudonocardiaceae bacterium]
MLREALLVVAIVAGLAVAVMGTGLLQLAFLGFVIVVTTLELLGR